MDVGRFPQQVLDLLSFLSGKIDKEHIFSSIRVQAGPDPETIPTVWLLGSSDFSARLAALIGLPFAFADFFGTTGGHGPRVAEIYRNEFQPSDYLREPRVNVTVQAMCAPTEKEALFMAASRNLGKAGSILEEHHRQMSDSEKAQYPTLPIGLVPPDEASDFPLSDRAKEYIESLRHGYLDGDPAQVKRMILDTAKSYGAQDVSVVTTCYSYENRRRSYQLIAEAFGLEPRS
jgi:alkanesulfonate monooxygenase SsuD/methylene tetrahydromethanopterin reductase-like flavin-dependent oxidoreductase (luciferase family)